MLSLVWLFVLPSLIFPLSFCYEHWNYFVGKGLNINEATASKIQREMTVSEVEELIGGPAGNYRFDQKAEFRFVCGEVGQLPVMVDWYGEDGTITVNALKGIVINVGWKPHQKSDLLNEMTWSVLSSLLCFGIFLVLYLGFYFFGGDIIFTGKTKPYSRGSVANSHLLILQHGRHHRFQHAHAFLNKSAKD